LALTGGLTTSAGFFATTFNSGFLDVTDAFFAGALGVTAGLAVALLTDFTAVLLAATVAFKGFLGAGLAIDLPAFETTLLVGLFAVFFIFCRSSRGSRFNGLGFGRTSFNGFFVCRHGFIHQMELPMLQKELEHGPG